MWVNCDVDLHRTLLDICAIHENRHSENHTLLQKCKSDAIHTLHIFCPICVKIDTRDLHIIVLSICSSMKISTGKMVLFLWAQTVWWQLIVIYDLVKSMCYIRVHHLQSCLLTEVYYRDFAARFDLQAVFWRCCNRW